MSELKFVEEVGEAKKVGDAKKRVLELTVGRHQRGIMHPWVQHVIANKQIKLEAGIEDPGRCNSFRVTVFLLIYCHLFLVPF